MGSYAEMMRSTDTAFTKAPVRSSAPRIPAQHAHGSYTSQAQVSGAVGTRYAGSHVATRYGIANETQRETRMAELTTKLGVDRVILEKGHIDTTPQAGHHTGPTGTARTPKVPPRGL